jgi:hypothetical protein
MTRKRLLEGDVLAKLRSLTTGMSASILVEESGCTEAELLAIAADELCEFRGGYGDEQGDFLEFERPPAAIAQIRSRAAREILRRLAAAPKDVEIEIELSLLREAFGDGYDEQLRDRLSDIVRSEWRSVSDGRVPPKGAHLIVSPSACDMRTRP